jgi:hypothetical protein
VPRSSRSPSARQARRHSGPLQVFPAVETLERALSAQSAPVRGTREVAAEPRVEGRGGCVVARTVWSASSPELEGALAADRPHNVRVSSLLSSTMPAPLASGRALGRVCCDRAVAPVEGARRKYERGLVLTVPPSAPARTARALAMTPTLSR